jgi:threonine dehydrogenase-like Zn-dependent dehydrogenase
MAREKAGAIAINYEEYASIPDVLKDLTGGRGPDHCIDAVGAEGHTHGVMYLHDRAKQMIRMQSDRPIALREAILSCRNGGTVSVIGVYTGLIDKFPMNAVMNRSLTIKSGQTHVHRYMKPLLDRIERGEIDPTFIITHRMPLADAAHGYKIFNDKLENCEKIVLKA